MSQYISTDENGYRKYRTIMGNHYYLGCDHPDSDAYERTALLCYKVDRRLMQLDVIRKAIKDGEEEAFYLEQRLGGMNL